MQIDLIKPYEKNAKVHNKKQIELLAENIKRYGFDSPIIVDKNNEIIAGHGRLQAASILGMTDVPIIKKETLTDEEVKAYRLADNQLNAMTGFEMPLVIEELKTLSEDLLNLTGFDRDLIIEPDEKDDKIPENVEPVAKPGDIWQLGRHRLMCGDSTKADDVAKLMDGKKADMLFTDPPYNVNYTDLNYKMRDGAKDWSYLDWDDDFKTKEQYQEFLINCLANAKASLIEYGHYYVWFAFAFYYELLTAFRKNEIQYDKVPIIWKKQTTPISWARYHRTYEPCLFGGKHVHTNKHGRWFGANNEKCVWEINTDHNNSYVHPTQKPVALAVRAINNSSQQNENVLDLFGGSGSTLIACEKMERNCYMMELDPKYCDVIIKRWEDYVGNGAKATKLN